MIKRTRPATAAVFLLALGLCACAALPSPGGGKPAICQPDAFARAANLPLPPPRPAPPSEGKGHPLRMADAVPVGGEIGDIGRWEDAGDNRRAWRLRLTSEGAKSLSVRLQPFDLPDGAEVWACSPDGHARFGPYRAMGPARTGRVSTPTVPGGELWLEAWTPADAAGKVRLRIAEIYVGFR